MSRPQALARHSTETTTSPLPPSQAPGLALAAMGRGLADPAHDAQQVFRQLLAAQSHPGRVQHLPAPLLAGLDAPVGAPGLAAALLCLLDAETSVWLPAAWQQQGLADWLRFHTGTRCLGTPEALAQAPFVAADPAALAAQGLAPAALWSQLNPGSDEQPQDGATLLLEVASLADSGPGALRLSGPGIAHTHTLAVPSLGDEFWQARQALAGSYPRGVDLLLCCGPLLAALPRTTRAQRLED